MALTQKRPVFTAFFTTVDTEESQRFAEEFSVRLCACGGEKASFDWPLLPVKLLFQFCLA
jgi:hypothetical protein